jgi:hypothetical protein
MDTGLCKRRSFTTVTLGIASATTMIARRPIKRKGQTRAECDLARTARLAFRLFGGDRNRLLLLLGIGRLWKQDGQNAALVACADPVGLDAGRHVQRTAEGAVATLGDIAVLGLLFLLLVLFTPDGEDTVGKLKVNILDIEARQLGRHFVSIIPFDDVDRRRCCETEIPAQKTVDVAIKRRLLKSGLEIPEQPIDLIAQRFERAPVGNRCLLRGCRRVCFDG